MEILRRAYAYEWLQMENDFDLIIIGAGPAGLATALGAKRCGVEKVLVLDQQPTIGNQLKGQSIHYRPELLTKIFPKKLHTRAFVSEIKSFGRNYYSPSGKKSFHLEDNIDRVWIDFRLFLTELAKQAVIENVLGTGQIKYEPNEVLIQDTGPR